MRSLLLAFPLLFSCSTDVQPRCESIGGFIGGATFAGAMHARVPSVGEPVSLRLTLGSFRGDCSGAGLDPEGKRELQVVDPENQLVEATLSEGSFEGEFLVGFTPALPGNYHVSLRSSPDGALAQSELTVAVDREGTPATVIDEDCNRVGRTASGAILCGEEVLRDGVSLRQIGPATATIAGDVIWTSTATSLRRFVDDGTALISVPANEQSLEQIHQISVTEDEVVALRFGFIDRYRATETEISLIGSAETNGDASGPLHLQRMGDMAFTLSLKDREGNQAADYFSGSLRACGYALGADGSVKRTEAACQRLEGALLGSTAESLWTLALPREGASFIDDFATRMVLRRYRAEGEHLVVASSVLVPSSVAVAVFSETPLLPGSYLNPVVIPHFASDWVLARDVDGEIVLERYSVKSDFRETSPQTLWLTPEAGKTAYIPF